VSTRQEFARQLVAAQQRELAVMAENAKLIETRVSIMLLKFNRDSDGMVFIIFSGEAIE